MKTKTLLIILAVINIFAISGWFYVLSLVSQKAEDIKILNNKIETLNRDAENNRMLKSETKKMSAEQKIINSTFLEQQDMIDFINKIEDLEKKTDVDMEIQSITAKQKDAGSKFQINLTGEFSDLFKYISLLENIQYQITIQKIALSANSETIKQDKTKKDVKIWSSQISFSI